MTIWEWLGCAGATDIIQVEVEVEVEVVRLFWWPLERKIPDEIGLAAFIEKDSFSVIWEMFELC